MRDFLKKIQNQPEKIKKIILWVIVSIVSLILFFVWINLSISRIASSKDVKIFQGIEIPKAEQEVNFSKEAEVMNKLSMGIERIDFSDEELEILERLMENIRHKEELNQEELNVLEKLMEGIEDMDFSDEELKILEEFMGGAVDIDEESLEAWDKLIGDMDI